MKRFQGIFQSLLRVLGGVSAVLALTCLAYALWSPGLDVRDGRHDRGQNGIWLQHGWLGADAWFERRRQSENIAKFRDPVRIAALAEQLRANGIRDVFPHVAPTTEYGVLPRVNDEQTERFLDAFESFRVMPWIGGALGQQAFPVSPEWRANFAASAAALLSAHPRLAGVHVNIEPCESGSPSFLATLAELRAALPPGKLLSVAAYPPPTRLHPYTEVHWDEAYYRALAERVDQVVPMMYDSGIGASKPYVWLMGRWTGQVLAWSAPRETLLGLPAYDDRDTGYHTPDVENVANGLAGVHAGLARFDALPAHYQGVALYSEWETDDAEWALWRERFRARPAAP
jgi:hypothetical protein